MVYIGGMNQIDPNFMLKKSTYCIYVGRFINSCGHLENMMYQTITEYYFKELGSVKAKHFLKRILCIENMNFSAVKTAYIDCISIMKGNDFMSQHPEISGKHLNTIVERRNVFAHSSLHEMSGNLGAGEYMLRWMNSKYVSSDYMFRITDADIEEVETMLNTSLRTAHKILQKKI